jgi:hypothetical protein
MGRGSELEPAAARVEVVRAGTGALVGVREFRGPARLLRMRPVTLRPVGRPLRMRTRYIWDFAVSPDGRRLAIGSDQRREIELFDLRRWRRVGVIPLPGPRPGGYGGSSGLVWVAPRRLLALSGPPFTRATPVVVDPLRRKVLHVSRWRGRPVRWQRAGDRLIVLSAPYGTSSPGRARLVSVAANGSLRQLRLGRIEAGYWRERGRPWRNFEPGLAVSRSGDHAYVVATDGRRVADVDLRAWRVEYHELTEPVSAWRRLQDLIEAPTHAKGEPVESRYRHAEMLANGAIAVTGEDMPAVRPPRRPRAILYGLRLIDPATWTVRTADSDAQDFTEAGGLLLARRWAYRDGKAPIGLRAYDNAGQPRFTRFPDTDVQVRGVAGRYAYVELNPRRANRRIHVIDLQTSRTVRVLPGRNVRLLNP